MDKKNPIEQYELELALEAELGLRDLEPPHRTLADLLNQTLRGHGPDGRALLQRWPQTLQQQFEQLARYEQATPSGEDHAQLTALFLMRLEEITRALLTPRPKEREILRPLLEVLEGDRKAWLDYFLEKPRNKPTMTISEAILAALPSAPDCPYLTDLNRRLRGAAEQLRVRAFANDFQQLRERRNGVAHAREECTQIEYCRLVHLALGTSTVGEWLAQGGPPLSQASILHLLLSGAAP
ncbi:hypothetical protein KJ940_17080 [Myxococcota bacterium]|nr:hypothetical protein [Myxococcota bacterium]